MEQDSKRTALIVAAGGGVAMAVLLAGVLVIGNKEPQEPVTLTAPAPSSGLTAALPEEPQAAPLQRKVQSLAAVPVRATAEPSSGKRRAVQSSSTVLVTAEDWKPNLRIRWSGVYSSDSVSGPVTLIAYSGKKKTQVVRTYTGKLSSLTFTAVHERGSCRAEVIANGTTYAFSAPALLNGFVGTDAAIGIEP